MSSIRTAIIGYGLAGRVFHAPLVAADARFALGAVVTSSAERAAAARADHPGIEVFSDASQLFARADDFDLVVLASPNETHAPLALEAIASGLHVVIDKPVAVTSGEARAVVDAASAAGTLVTVFQNRRWDGDFLTLSEVIASGALGDIRQFDSAFEWFRPDVVGGWKDTTTPEAGGGILYDLGPHLIDQAIQLFGPVASVHSELDRRRRGAVNDDDAFLSLLHENGVRSRLWMSAVSPAPRPRLRVVGSRAVFRSESLDPQEAQSIAGMRTGDPGFGLHADGRTATLQSPTETLDVPLRAGDHLEFYRRLADALAGTGPVPVDPADSVRVLEIIEAAHNL